MIHIADVLLLVCVVRRSRGDRVVELARAAGATGSTVFLGRGTAQNRILHLLCLADTQKELVFTLAPVKIMPAIVQAVRSAPDLCKKVPGIGFTARVQDFMRSGPGAAQAQTPKGKPMSDTERQLICVIVNKGLADDIMIAARAAGARGGTILKARGTGTDKDGSFFGITIVPEKEMLMIISPRQEAGAILKAIEKCECLAEPGAGIVFCLPVEDFFPLGANSRAGEPCGGAEDK